MTALTTCLKNAGKRLSAEDRTLIRNAASDYRADGITATEAALRAIDDVMDIALKERADLAAQVKKAGGEIPAYAPAAVKPPKGYGKKNKVFTEDALAAAMSDLKGSLGQLNVGLDPKQMSALITVAGFHIEAGAREFAAFAKAMVDALGEGVRPFLPGLYENIRRYPGMEDVAKNMTSTKQVDKESAKIGVEAKKDEDKQADAGVDTEGAVATGGRPGVRTDDDGDRRLGGRVEGEQPGDVPGAAAGGAGTAAGTGATGEGMGEPGSVRTGGDAGDGRPGAGGEGLVSGTGGTGAGTVAAGGTVGAAGAENTDSALPVAGNFSIENPLEIVGGGQVARFKKNQESIELYAELQSEGRHPTHEEQKTLAGYTGWGSFGQELFQGNWENPAPKDGWAERDKWLRQQLGKEKWESAQRSITNAHYTDPPTVMAMWDMMRRMGFEGGKVLEPAMGIGNFFGMMPVDIQHNSLMTGIELDEMTGGIAKMLYPDANVSVKGYQDSHTPDDFYDLVIGNWPFENTVIADRRYNRLSPYLHDYFFLKAIDQVRPGGIVMGITSKGTLDKLDKNIRIALAKKAELVAAFRLPSGAFQEYAGTKVVTDIIILKKRPAKLGILTEADNWISSLSWKTTSEPVSVNEYYHENKDNVVGTIDYGSGTTFGRAGLIVHRPKDMAAELNRIVALVPEGVYTPADQTKHIKYITNHTDDRQGSLVNTDEGFFIVRGEHLVAANDVRKYIVKAAATNKKREAQFNSLIEMRKAYASLIEAERSSENAAEITAARKALKASYDAFRATHGALRDSFGLNYLKRIDDPSFTTLAALENNTGTRDKPVWSPAQILTKSTSRSKNTIKDPTVSDAYVLARNESVRPSVARIAEIAGVSEAEAKEQLLKSGAVYEVLGGGVEPADVFLSGNVRQKLRQVQAQIADGHTELEPSAAALQKAIPKDIPYHEIEARMGATWVATGIYRDYIGHMLNLTDREKESVEVTFVTGRWKIKFPTMFNRKSEAQTGFGSTHKWFKTLVNAAISNQSITVKYKDDEGVTHVDVEATKEVGERIAKIRDDFSEWVWNDPERRIELEREYNEARNSWATPKYDGSFLSFEGMALQFGENPFNLREHQVNAIWRAVVNRRSLNAHEVGTGKTFTIGGIAVESRRYGIAKKPLILAHNANSASVAIEIQEMYPAAKVLYINNLSPKTIGIKMRQIANDDWDAIVMPHSLIDRLSLTEATLMGMAQEEIAQLESEAREAAEEDGYVLTDEMLKDEEELVKLRSPTAKDLVKSRNKIIETIKKHSQRAAREDAVPFEELGIDMVMVDEVHEFKKPTIVTKMRMKGLNTKTSNKSLALQFLTRYTRANNNGGNVHTFSGTPITNTLSEIYHQMRYIMEDEMADASIDYWDGWFGSFASEVSDVELNAAAEYENVTRLAAFINVPELRKMLGQYMDVVFSDTMPEMQPRETESGKTLTDKTLTDGERAELENGRSEGANDRPYKKVIVDTADMTDIQLREFQILQGYSRAFRAMSGKDRWDVMREGRPESPILTEGLATKASFDPRLLRGTEIAGQEGEIADEPGSKASRVINNVMEIYKSHDKATQVIFTELGLGTRVTRSEGRGEERRTWTEPNFSTVRDIIERLVKQGVPREQIALVTGSTTKEKRAEIAAAMNRAEIRVVLGNTKTLGVGVNMQKNLRAMHHLDAPWMPGDLEQRNGRGHRQGNQWNTVLEFRYITDRLDGRRWQILSIKQRFINAFLSGNTDERTIEGDAASDEQSDILETFAEAAGDPRVLIKEKIKKKIERLRSKERLHTMAVADAKSEIRRLSNREESDQIQYEHAVRVSNAISTQLEKFKGDAFEALIDGKKYTDRAKTDAAIAKIVASEVRIRGNEVELGTIMGFPVRAWQHKLWPAPGILIDIESADNVDDEGNVTGDILQTIEAYKTNVASVAGKLRGEVGIEQNYAARIAENKRAAERAEAVSKEKFKLQPKLDMAIQELTDIEEDMAANPVPPPAWLRQGAPVDTEVVWGGEVYSKDDYLLTDDVGWARPAKSGDTGAILSEGYGWVIPMSGKKEFDKTFVVTGHRWTPDGWFVLAEDDKGAVLIPYLEALDAQGFQLYEEREFKAPEVVQRPEDADEQPADQGQTDRPMHSRQSITKSRKIPTGVPVSDVVHAMEAFSKDFDNQLDLTFRVAVDKESAFGDKASDYADTTVKGAYYGKSRIVLVIASQLNSIAEAMETLRHEILAHHGLNLFKPADKKAILKEVMNSRNSRSLKAIWNKIDVDYADSSEIERAEEVIALIAQDKQGIFTKAWGRIVRAIRKAMKAINLIDETMTKAEINGLISEMESRLKRGDALQTFPASDKAQFTAEEDASKLAAEMARRGADAPADEGFDAANPDVMYSRTGGSTDVQQEQETLNKSMDAGQPIDKIFRALFKLLRVEKATGKIYEQGAHYLTEAKFPESFSWLNPMLETARAGLIDRYGLPESFIAREFEASADKRNIELQGLDILKAMESRGITSVAEAEVFQAIVNGKAIPNEAWKDLTEPVRDAIDQLGHEAMDLGLITRESYERNRGTYLHRVYRGHEAQQTRLGKWSAKLAGNRRKQIRGDELKGRGMNNDVAMGRLLRDAPQDWWGRKMKAGKADKALHKAEFIILDLPAAVGQGTEPLIEGGKQRKPRVARRVYWPAELPIPDRFGAYENKGKWEVRDVTGAKVRLWRDFTKAERTKMGEILDARYTIAKTFMLMAHDLSTGRMLKDISENEEWAVRTDPGNSGPPKHAMSTYSNVEWVQVPDSKVAGTKVKKWGALAGMYVRAEIWRDLNELDRMQTPTFWNNILSFWKVSKTARNPVVHLNNVMSNLAFMDMADIRWRDLKRGIMSFHAKDEHYEDARRHGAFGASYIEHEIRRETLDPILNELLKQDKALRTGPVENWLNSREMTAKMAVLGKILDVTGKGVVKADRKMIDAYQAEDEIFRMATYMRRLEMGDPPIVAARIARDQFLNYDIRAPWVNAARRSFLPFISYTYRAVPVIAKSMAERPWKVAKYATIAYAANALAYAITGDDEDEERRSLNERVQGRTWLQTPRMIKMPWHDEHGNPVFLDIRRWIPAGDVFDMSQNQGAVPLPAWLQFGGPLMIAAELALNKQAFTGKEIYNAKTDTGLERTAAVGEFLWHSVAPSAPWIPGSWYWDKIGRAWSGGRDSLGRDYSLPYAALSSLGVKFAQHDVELNFSYKAKAMESIARELKWQSQQLAKDKARKIIDNDEYERGIGNIKRKVDRLKEEAKETFGK